LLRKGCRRLDDAPLRKRMKGTVKGVPGGSRPDGGQTVAWAGGADGSAEPRLVPNLDEVNAAPRRAPAHPTGGWRFSGMVAGLAFGLGTAEAAGHRVSCTPNDRSSGGARPPASCPLASSKVRTGRPLLSLIPPFVSCRVRARRPIRSPADLCGASPPGQEMVQVPNCSTAPRRAPCFPAVKSAKWRPRPAQETIGIPGGLLGFPAKDRPKLVETLFAAAAGDHPRMGRSSTNASTTPGGRPVSSTSFAAPWPPADRVVGVETGRLPAHNSPSAK